MNKSQIQSPACSDSHESLFDSQKLSHSQSYFVISQNHCPLCNHQLSIEILPTTSQAQVIEEASCSRCKIKTRIQTHPNH